MGFEGFGIEKLLLIFIIVLLVFGAKRIPEIAASMGKGIREFKKSMNEVHASVTDDGSSAGAAGMRAVSPPAPQVEEVPREVKRLM